PLDDVHGLAAVRPTRALPPLGPHPLLMNEPREQLRELIRGYRISQAIYVVTRLGIPDLLADVPRVIDDLSRATESHAPSLRRVLLFLAGVGVLDDGGRGRGALTPVGALLGRGVPGSHRSAVL